jgi:outer membrane receptor protein involved in Fe transport
VRTFALRAGSWLALVMLLPLPTLRAQQARPDSSRADSLRARRRRADALGPDVLRALFARQDSLDLAGDTLTRQPVQLGAVTITAAPTVRYEPSSAVRVTAAALQAAPASDPYDLLRQTAGLEVHDQGQGPGFASDASVRGFSSDHSTDLALWVDGVPVNEPINGHAEGYADWNLLLPDAIADVDVVKGPTSALYGNFAMAGVVNVRTIERMAGTRFDLRGGSYGRLDGTLLTGLDQGATGAVLAVRGVREDGWRPHAGYDIGQVHSRLVRRFGGTSTLDAAVDLYGTRWDSPGFLSDSLFALRRYDVVADPTDGGFKRRAQERVSYRTMVGGALWRSTLYATQGRWQLFLTIPPEPGAGEGSGSQTEEEDRRYGFGATSALTWALRRGEVTVGFEGRWDHADFENWLTTARQRDSAQIQVRARQASGALFVQGALDLTPHLRATLGARWTALDTRSTPVGEAAVGASHGILVPKLGLLYHIPSVGALYANVSRGFRQTDGVITDPTLPFITEWAYEVGAKVGTRRLGGGVALFRMDVSDEQTFDPVHLTTSSGGASRRQGVEVEVTARPAPAVTLSADWTFNDARYRHLVTEEDTLDGARVFNTARYVGIAGVAVAPADARWRLGMSVSAVGPYSPFDEPGVVLPAFALLHLSGGVQLARWGTLDLGVRNVLDRAYPELSAGGFVSPGQPRTVYAAVRLHP